MLIEGQKSPAFSGMDQDGNKLSLANYKGKKLVIFFYPQDDTPTCTLQACNLRDNYALLRKHGFEVLGISPDEASKHIKFREKYMLPFTLITDTGLRIINKFGVWGEKNMYGRKYMGLLRTTFVINEKGIIITIFRKPKVKQHAEEIIKKTSTTLNMKSGNIITGLKSKSEQPKKLMH
jgi:thioredoxin-dependent peroxiredoxin